jgi:RNA polymerase sigma factor (sigma-70 family)
MRCGFYLAHSLPTGHAANDPARAGRERQILGQDAQLDGKGSAIIGPDALRTFLENHRDLLRFLSRRLRCLYTARDLSQEVYLRFAGAGDDDAIENPRALLFRIAANVATDHVRVESRRSELMQDAYDLLWVQADEISPERQVFARDDLAHISAALARLPERTRHIFYLNRFEGKTQREIALQLGVSRTSVEKHMRRALNCVAEARDQIDLS